jgi:hypothetical protein
VAPAVDDEDAPAGEIPRFPDSTTACGFPEPGIVGYCIQWWVADAKEGGAILPKASRECFQLPCLARLTPNLQLPTEFTPASGEVCLAKRPAQKSPPMDVQLELTCGRHNGSGEPSSPER